MRLAQGRAQGHRKVGDRVRLNMFISDFSDLMLFVHLARMDPVCGSSTQIYECRIFCEAFFSPAFQLFIRKRSETAQARAITQDLGTLTVPLFQPFPLKESKKPDLIKES